MADLWDMTPYSLVIGYLRFRDTSTGQIISYIAIPDICLILLSFPLPHSLMLPFFFHFYLLPLTDSLPFLRHFLSTRWEPGQFRDQATCRTTDKTRLLTPAGQRFSDEYGLIECDAMQSGMTSSHRHLLTQFSWYAANLKFTGLSICDSIQLISRALPTSYPMDNSRPFHEIMWAEPGSNCSPPSGSHVGVKVCPTETRVFVEQCLVKHRVH